MFSTQVNPSASSNYVKSSVFRQEIARFEINVVRAGKAPLPITQVPRVQQGDVLKIKLLDEAVNGIKLDQSQWDWSLLVAYINPARRSVNKAESGGGTVSEEIQFRKRGWYREYSFTVPYDSQPVFFLYPKSKYRAQLVKVVNSKYEEIRKLGEKTIEIAGAYAQISSFLNELQIVLNRNAQMYGYTYNGSNTSNIYNPYNPYYPTIPTSPMPPDVPVFGLNTIPALNQMVDGLAKTFNITLPSCWGNTSPNSSYGYYPGTTGYSTGYGTSSGTSTTADFVNRAQCVAKNVNLQDFDFSVMKMWQQGGVFLAAELQKKYPQLAYYINIAAVAIDFIVKAFQKSPLRIVPSIIQSTDNPASGSSQNSYNSYTPGGAAAPNGQSTPVKISVFAESQPSEGQFVTAYPIVVHKWQANPDPDVISLYPPVLSEPCLHSGQNILKNTDLSEQWSEDTYSRDFKLVMSSSNGFRKEFPLKKNIGLGGWELNITPEDMNQIPKISMTLESEIVGMRGFNEIRSPKFDLPVSMGGSWEITPESLKNFTVGGKRTITLRNTLGSCRCLQRVTYKPSFGGQFVFEANSKENGLQFSADGREVSFQIDAGSFQPGQGTLEIKTYNNDQPGQINQQQSNTLNLKLYPLPPNITNVKIAKGDSEALISGERLDQIQYVKINGKRAVVLGGNNTLGQPATPASTPTGYSNQVGPQINNPYSNNNQNRTQGANPNLNPSPNQGNNQAVNPNAPNVSPGNAVSTTPNLSSNPGLNEPAAVNQQNSSFQSQYSNPGPNEKIFVFEDNSAKQTEATVSIELGLEDNRSYQNPKTFTAAPSRPAIAANQLKEIEVQIVDNKPANTTGNIKSQDQKATTTALKSSFDLNSYPVIPIDTREISLKLQNILTDYDFKVENLSIETRIEKSRTNQNALPTVAFEVLDWKNIRLNLALNDGVQKLLGGRRLQFRIRDRERGDSDWYTIKQTFVRIPKISSIKCADEMNKMCQLKGDGIDYIMQISVDGGNNWYPQSPNTLQAQPAGDGQKSAMIPSLEDKKMLQIKLRDYPTDTGLPVLDFSFSNTVKKLAAKPAVSNNPNQKAVVPENQPGAKVPADSNNPVNQSPPNPALPAAPKSAQPVPRPGVKEPIKPKPKRKT